MNRPLVAAVAAMALIGAATVGRALDTRHAIVGQAHVVDGDTIRVGKVRIRLQGLDAPEMSHPGGSRARVAMRQIVGSSPVSCIPDGSMTHGRVVAICTVGGADIAAELVRRGVALDCARFSGGRYAHLETDHARRSQRRASYCR